MRRRLIVSALVLMATMYAPPARAATITLENLTQSGNAFSVDVLVEDAVDLFTFSFDFLFEPDLISSVDVLEGSLLRSAVQDAGGNPIAETVFAAEPTLDVTDIDGNLVRVPGFVFGTIADAEAVAGVTGSGLLATLTFTLAADLATIEFLNPLLFDSVGNMEIPDLSPASLTIGEAGTPVPEPSTLLLMGIGLAGLARRRIRRR
jgi:hypothetical protein